MAGSPVPVQTSTTAPLPGVTADTKALAMSGQENSVPAAEEARPHSFLSLAPKTSASYPASSISKSPASLAPRQPVEHSTIVDELSEKVAAAPEHAKILGDVDEDLLKATRSESMSSEASNSTTSSGGAHKTLNSKRFLKLGPVHFGESDGTGLGDWSEEVLEE